MTIGLCPQGTRQGSSASVRPVHSPGIRGTPSLFIFKRRDSEWGQSVVEFALVLPLLVFLMVAIIDLARIYTTMLSVESAAREAADYGSFGAQKWNPATFNIPPDGVVPKMQQRACTAASNLTDFAGSVDTCTNPGFSYQVSPDLGATWGELDPSWNCNDAERTPNPCWVKATLTYDFHLLVPLNLDFLGVSLGLPEAVTFQRDSIFPMTDLSGS